jgi:hypothetical protein
VSRRRRPRSGWQKRSSRPGEKADAFHAWLLSWNPAALVELVLRLKKDHAPAVLPTYVFLPQAVSEWDELVTFILATRRPHWQKAITRRWLRWQEDMKDRARADAVLEGRGLGLPWATTYHYAEDLLSKTPAAGSPETMKRAYGHVRRDPARYYMGEAARPYLQEHLIVVAEEHRVRVQRDYLKEYAR